MNGLRNGLGTRCVAPIAHRPQTYQHSLTALRLRPLSTSPSLLAYPVSHAKPKSKSNSASASPHPPPSPQDEKPEEEEKLYGIPRSQVAFGLKAFWSFMPVVAAILYYDRNKEYIRAKYFSGFTPAELPAPTAEEKAAPAAALQITPPLASQVEHVVPKVPVLIKDPSTSMEFPSIIKVPSVDPPSLLNPATFLELVGIGERLVSFLKVRVYVAAFYLDGSKFPVDYVTGDEEAMERYLTGDAVCALRIVPARNTDFSHLRDGFVRSIQARLKSRSKVLNAAGTPVTEEEEEKNAAAIEEFKSFFPSGRSAPKGTELLLVKTHDRGLELWFEGERLGHGSNPLMAQSIFNPYFADKTPISPKLRATTIEGLKHRDLEERTEMFKKLAQ